MLPMGVFAILRATLVAQIAFELACLEPGNDGVLSDYAMSTFGTVVTHMRLANGRCTSRGPAKFLRPRVDEPWNQLPGGLFEQITGFHQPDFIQMCSYFELLPTEIKTKNGCVATKTFVIFLLLFRWTCPWSWTSIEERLQQNRSRLIDLYQAGVELIYNVPGYRLLSTKLDMPRIYSKIQEWGDAVWDTGAREEGRFIGFVDGAPQRCSRPSARAAAKRKFGDTDVHRLVYNLHYSAHGLRLQYVCLVDAIMVCEVDSLTTSDSGLLKQFGVIETLRAVDIDGDPTKHPMIYGDPAYAKCDVVSRKSKGLRTALQRLVDRSMQSSRASVEDAFGYLLVCANRNLYSLSCALVHALICCRGRKPSNISRVTARKFSSCALRASIFEWKSSSLISF